MKNELLICNCYSAEHQMIISYDEKDRSSDVYVDIHLAPDSFWMRVKYALKYIFGYQCKYGAFEQMELGSEHVEQLQSVINHLKGKLHDGQTTGD